MKNKWSKLANEESLQKTRNSLEKNGFKVYITNNKKEALNKFLEIVPKGIEIMNNSSVTLDEIGISKEVMETKNYDAVKKKITSVNQKEMRDLMRKQATIAEYAIGSVHAITENGEILIASNSGSQLPGYAFSASKVIFFVGTQKIVKNIDEAFNRIKEYSLPLESERLKKIYGIPSNVSKVLIINKEINPERISVIFVKETLGF